MAKSKLTASQRDRLKILEAKKREEEKLNKTSINKICGNCRFGIPADYEGNRSMIDGHALTVRCKYYEDGKYGQVLNNPACLKWGKK